MNTLYPKTHINEISFSLATRGWICDINFRHETHRQFTWESHTIRGYSPRGWTGWVGILWSFQLAIIRCAVFAYRCREHGGGVFNTKSGAMQRMADWIMRRISDRSGTVISG